MESLLNQLRPPKGAVKNKKRLGRGESSGLGKTSGKGHKGQKARAGGYHKVGFEGGQMPLHRRIPKRGFLPPHQAEITVVNLRDLAGLAPQTEVTVEFLLKEGILRKCADGLKVLGDGELKNPLIVKADFFSASARTKIEKAGGQAVVLSQAASPQN